MTLVFLSSPCLKFPILSSCIDFSYCLGFMLYDQFYTLPLIYFFKFHFSSSHTNLKLKIFLTWYSSHRVKIEMHNFTKCIFKLSYFRKSYFLDAVYYHVWNSHKIFEIWEEKVFPMNNGLWFPEVNQSLYSSEIILVLKYSYSR